MKNERDLRKLEFVCVYFSFNGKKMLTFYNLRSNGNFYFLEIHSVRNKTLENQSYFFTSDSNRKFFPLEIIDILHKEAQNL